MTDTADLVKCGKCGFPIHPSETGVRHFGFYVAHSEERCTSLLQAALSSTQARADKLEAELAEAKREIERLRENHRVAVHRKRVTGEYRDDFKARAEAAETSLTQANERVKELEGALKPFAAKADLYEANHPTGRHPLRDATQITHRLGDFRAARTALKTAGKE